MNTDQGWLRSKSVPAGGVVGAAGVSGTVTVPGSRLMVVADSAVASTTPSTAAVRISAPVCDDISSSAAAPSVPHPVSCGDSTPASSSEASDLNDGVFMCVGLLVVAVAVANPA